MSGSARRAGRALRRPGRLLVGRNELRRPADRIEAAVIITLAAVFLTTVIAAACLAGQLCHSQRAAARLRPTHHGDRPTIHWTMCLAEVR